VPVNTAKDITEIVAGHVHSTVGSTLIAQRLRSSAKSLTDEFRIATLSKSAPDLLVELLAAFDDEQFESVVSMDEATLSLADELVAAEPPSNLAVLLLIQRLWPLTDTVAAIIEGRAGDLTLFDLARATDAHLLLETLLRVRVAANTPLSVEDVGALMECDELLLCVSLDDDLSTLAHVELTEPARAELARNEYWNLLRLLSANDHACTALLRHAATDHSALGALVGRHEWLHPAVAERVVALASTCLAGYGDEPAPRSVRTIASNVLQERLATSVDMFVDAVVQECHLVYASSLPPEENPTGTWRALTDLVEAAEGVTPPKSSFVPVGLFLRSGDLERIRLRLSAAAKTNSALEQLLRHVAREAAPTSRDPQFAEYVDLCWAMGNAARVQHLDGGPQWLADLLDTTLGDDRHRWETFFGLLGSWTLTLSELLDTTQQITHNFDDQSPSSKKETP
jgi:hypothetical protein